MGKLNQRHDKYKWNIKRTLGEMIPNYIELPEDVKKYILEYMLSDLSYQQKVVI